MEKQNILIQKVLETLYAKDQHLSEKDKAGFPLIYRAINAINEVFLANNTPIRYIQVKTITNDSVWFEVNESSPVTFIPCQPVPIAE